MVLTDILTRTAENMPDRRAMAMPIGFRTKVFTYGEMFSHARRVATFLKQQGIEKGDPVVLLAPNSPYLVHIMWAVWLRGAIIVPLNIQSTGDIIKGVIEQTKAKLVFTHKGFHHLLPDGMTIKDIEYLEEETVNCLEADLNEISVHEDDLAQIMYTSGTTGNPKGVMLTHGNMATTVCAVTRQVDITEDDRILSILPLSHVYEQIVGFLAPYHQGALIVYLHRPSALVTLMQEYEITKMIAVPEFLSLLMRKIEHAIEDKGKTKLVATLSTLAQKIPSMTLRRLLFSSVHREFGGALEVVASGGAPLDPLLEEKWKTFGVTILQGYGLTEVAGVATMNTFREQQTGAVGIAIPDVTLTIADDGEILLAGPSVFKGYYHNEEATREALDENGAFHTGDIGEVDDRGFLYIKGRKKYMILSAGGQNVYPEDVETALNQQPEVIDSCVIGIMKEEGHADIHAVLLLEEGNHDLEAIVGKANEGLASFQAINSWSQWTENDFPRTSSRKIKREEVKKWVAANKTTTDEASGSSSKLHALLSGVTGISTNTITDDMVLVRDLHIDSLLRVELVTRIESEYRVAVEESDITDTTTVAELEQAIESAGPVQPRKGMPKWLISSGAYVTRIVLQPLFFLIASLLMRVTVDGKEHLQKIKGPVLFMPNHKSVIDSVALTMALPWRLKPNVAHAAGEDIGLFHSYGVFGTLAQLVMTAFPLPRKSASDISFGLEQMGWFLDQGYSVVVFPEGDTTARDELLAFKRGSGLMATQMNVPVVPVFIEGTQNVTPPHDFQIKGFWEDVHIRFGAPITFSNKDSIDRVTEELYREVLALKREHKIEHKWNTEIAEATK